MLVKNALSMVLANCRTRAVADYGCSLRVLGRVSDQLIRDFNQRSDFGWRDDFLADRGIGRCDVVGFCNPCGSSVDIDNGESRVRA